MKKSITTAGITLAMAASFALPAIGHAAPAPDPDMSTKLAGKTVFLDPGHQGTGHSENLSRQVDDGRGGTKDCQTTGMTALGGTPEHTINWDVTQLVKSSLESLGAKVVLSRNDDTGWGGCVDERAKAASASGADVAASIHADGAPAEDHGFHLIVPQLPIPNPTVNEVQSTKGLTASTDMRDAYVNAGFSPANYAGVQNGLQTRADIAGPALTTVPLVFVEMGNGGNPDDAKMLEGKDGQLKHAIAITTGLVSYLLGTPPVAPAPAAAVTPARGTPPSTTTTGPTTTAPTRTGPSTTQEAAPSTSTPKATAPTTSKPADGVSTTIAQLLRPLLNALGIGGGDSLADEQIFDTLSDVFSTVLDAFLNSDKPATTPTAPAPAG
ncbi:N-acetylmuramoyl-L-alanine amidase [Antrihabitans cavernicola]|uniref:N-acetylmuramoyl-L-alanine amidase n=1 Tax=Antrihabitans cavernicola TaxID=2495913 RepID=A0A5A7SJK1_9NOCA|nr:N-acetylmuramoyl-L-alanine amidase [Spelaeibacter cavernicola]KAA0024371.1 N-acetylmuramoyl-L-alanine amidase [Spelaeibacter cavernicola]